MKLVFMIVCLHITMCTGSCVPTFLPENARVPGQHGLQ